MTPEFSVLSCNFEKYHVNKISDHFNEIFSNSSISGNVMSFEEMELHLGENELENSSLLIEVN